MTESKQLEALKLRIEYYEYSRSSTDIVIKDDPMEILAGGMNMILDKLEKMKEGFQ